MLRKIMPWFGSKGELPTTANQPSKIPDGSGKSIKMESSLAKAMRSADGYIKGTYLWFFISIFFIWAGWSLIRRNSAYVTLDCDSGECTLTIQPPYSFLPRNSDSGIPMKTRSRSKRRTKIEFKRDQLVRADNIKWNPETQIIVENYGINSPTYSSSQQQNTEEQAQDEGDAGPGRSKNQRNRKKKNKHKRHKPAYNRGPDKNGHYDSYVIILRDPLPMEEENADSNESPSKRMARQMAAQHDHMLHDPNSLASLLAPFAISLSNNEYIIHPRDFNLQTRRLARTIVSKIVGYTKGRRSSFIVRESRPVSWQGLLLLILGIFSFVLCLLLGQFWEEYDPTKAGSYRKRMAEIRKRQEASKLRQKRSVRRKPPIKRYSVAQPALKRNEAAPDKQRFNESVKISTAGTSMRARHNAGVNRNS